MTDNEKKVTLSEAELETVISNSIVRAFTEMGIDTRNPEEQQRDMAHLRRWRKAVDKTTSTTFTAAIVTITTGLLGALYLGITTLLQTK